MDDMLRMISQTAYQSLLVRNENEESSTMTDSETFLYRWMSIEDNCCFMMILIVTVLEGARKTDENRILSRAGVRRFKQLSQQGVRPLYINCSLYADRWVEFLLSTILNGLNLLEKSGNKAYPSLLGHCRCAVCVLHSNISFLV